ncbi:MAG: class I SAM-dependent DNA methyltransferase [Porphyromonadaceae bacterium]|jgi:hypothetical protein|nr:class I SAM-dependent DNA methyltransferase [Porphyromonadaceae bacterium]
MTSKEIELNLIQLAENPINHDFIFDFLLAYGISKTSVTRLKKGDFNMSKFPGEVLYKGKIFFKNADSENLLYEVEGLAKDERILKQNPRFVLLTDNKTFAARDLKLQYNKEFALEELPRHFEFFLPLIGGEIYKQSNNNEADRNAAYELAKLYDILIEDNPALKEGHTHLLNVFLARVLFCFFAEDTGIFAPGIFTNALRLHTKEDGADVHVLLNDLFRKLDSKTDNHPAYVQHFPYVNGGLFRQIIDAPMFSRKSRNILLNCSELDWSEINPDIFGSMIQAVADPEERSDLGMHYTSVENILKLIRPLFLDELYAEFEKNNDNDKALRRLINRMGKIKFFDPACGSGNFLIITYKELRLLEIKIIQRLIELDAERRGELQFYYTQIALSQFYGIEIKDFAHEIAMLSLWLAEHQMNMVFENELPEWGKSIPILPLKQAGHIVCANAATKAWEEVCPRNEDDEIYLIGNPPYLGARMQDKSQKEDIENTLKGIKGYNNLDYISIWFYKGAKYIQDYNAKLAFVSTNSICQGQQVSLIWSNILDDNIEINFAHTSFKWTNNAIGNAGVTVIIVGLRNSTANSPKYLFSNNIRKEVKNINAYLLDSSNIYIASRSKPLSNFPEMNFGNMANDGGNLLLNAEEKEQLVKNRDAINFIKNFQGSYEFLNGINRYCLWIEDNEVKKAKSIKPIEERIEKTKKHRNNSTREATRKLALEPFRFGEIRHKDTDSIIIPRVSSERREYIPIGFLTSDTIIADSAMAIYDAQPWLFGILHSKMHMVWVDAVGGKLKTDYRYSAKLCYNTFPFPPITEKQKYTINHYVFSVLDERARFPQKTMAWLYNPETMPAGLRQAHRELDQAIERCYRLAPFSGDAERLEYLFRLYDEMTRRDTLWAKEKKKRRR